MERNKNCGSDHLCNAPYSELSIKEKNLLISTIEGFSAAREYQNDEEMFNAKGVYPGELGLIKIDPIAEGWGGLAKYDNGVGWFNVYVYIGNGVDNGKEQWRALARLRDIHLMNLMYYGNLSLVEINGIPCILTESRVKIPERYQRIFNVYYDTFYIRTSDDDPGKYATLERNPVSVNFGGTIFVLKLYTPNLIGDVEFIDIKDAVNFSAEENMFNSDAELAPHAFTYGPAFIRFDTTGELNWTFEFDTLTAI